MLTVRTKLLSLVIILLSSIPAFAGTQQSAITMSLPENLIKDAIHKTLPVHFSVNSNTILGTVSIDTIENLQFKENKISSRITLSGHELNLVTNIAGHDIRMKIGSLTLAFQCDTTIRFDVKTQTLYLRPVLTEIQPGDHGYADIASALIPLFNNREIPLQLAQLKPIMADTGNKILNISLNIANMQIKPETVQLTITPGIEARNKKGKQQTGI